MADRPTLKMKMDFWNGRRKQLEQAHDPWRGIWKDCGRYAYPNRGDFTSEPQAKGERRTQDIFDPTAPWSLEQFAAGLVGFLTSPTERFMELELVESELNRERPVAEYMELITGLFYDEVFSNPMTNFGPQSHTLYMDLGGFGTGIFDVQDLPGEPINFGTHHLNDCLIYENRRGLVDVLYRRVMKSGRELLEKYSKLFTETQRNQLEKKEFDKFETWHGVEPIMNDHMRGMVNTNKKFASVLFFPKFDVILEEGGFDSFPYVVPRWLKSTGEMYGRSPTMTALPVIKLVNRMMETIIKSAQKITDPALQVPDEGFLLPIKTTPSGLNFYRAGSSDRIEPILSGGQPQIGFELLQDRQMMIKKIYNVDLLEFPEDKKERSATEAQIIQDSNTRKLVPNSSRMNMEFMTPMIKRVFDIMMKRGRFPDPPREMSGVPIRVRYVSPIIRAQRASQLIAATRWMEIAVQLMQIKPEAADKINADEWIAWSHELLGASQKLVNPEEAVKQIRDARKQDQDMQNQSESIKNLGQGAAAFAKAGQLSEAVGAI